MNSAVKMWMIAAFILLVVGIVIFFMAFVTADFDISKLFTQKFEKNIFEFNEDFENIYVNVETTTVNFVPSDDGVCKVECFEKENMKHSAEVQDGTLTVSIADNRKWYDHITINFGTPTVTIYLPKDVYTSLSAKTTTGNIEVPDGLNFETIVITGTTSNVSCYADASTSIELNTTTGDIRLGSLEAGAVKLSATTGTVKVNDVSCNKLTAKSSTGHIKLENTVANESIILENTTGGIRFNGCDAGEITVRTSTGSVRGTLLSEKIFITDTSTGRINVPKTASGGKCEITTSTGDIDIDIE